jgi:AcrR family transcriptional regulator
VTSPPPPPERPSAAPGERCSYPPRRPAGAAVLREDVTAAIRDAFFQELAEVGYARLSIQGVARRAGVGKTAVYRRWASKSALVLDLVSMVGNGGLPNPATGSLLGDLRAILDVTARALRHPVAAQVIPDLLVEAARHPELADTIRVLLLDPQRGVASAIVRDAVARGELPAETDPNYLLDLTLGPLYWRFLVARGPFPSGYLDQLAGAAAAALGKPGSGQTSPTEDSVRPNGSSR